MLSNVSKVDEEMRALGYVTAREVADALGAHLTTVHHGIDRGSIPGKRIQMTGRNGRWYVKIREFRDSYPKELREIRAKLGELANLVPKGT